MKEQHTCMVQTEFREVNIKYGRAGGPGHALIYAHVVGMFVLVTGCGFLGWRKIGGRPKSYGFTSRYHTAFRWSYKEFQNKFGSWLMWFFSLPCVGFVLTLASVAILCAQLKIFWVCRECNSFRRHWVALQKAFAIFAILVICFVDYHRCALFLELLNSA